MLTTGDKSIEVKNSKSHGTTISSKVLVKAYYLNSSAELSRETDGIRANTGGAAVAAALDPATLAAAPAPGRGYFDWSSCSVRLDVISITGVGEAVGCWLLIEKARKIVEEESV